MKKASLLLLGFLVTACARAPLTDPEKAFRPAAAPEALLDSYPIATLRDALTKTIAAYRASTTIPAAFTFADRRIPRADYLLALEALLRETDNFERFHGFVREHFDFYEVYGGERWGEVFSTGYYEATLRGSRKPTLEFTEPLYRTPPDLVSVDLAAYAERLPDVKPLQDLVREQKAKRPLWRGRLVNEGKTPKVVPYYTRAEIQRSRPLAGKGLELCYVKPIDAFYLEIQGSGVVELNDGSRLRLGYDSQNGSPYAPIGRFLTHAIPLEQMSMQRIRAHLETLDREQLQSVFDQNPSYVFFQELPGQSLTYSGAEVTAQRTIASDQFLFPKGTLGFLEIEQPVFAAPADLEPARWEMRPRWVLDQDTGGAIRGGGRIDLFTGAGPEAERAAGVMKRNGRLWVVAPKEELLSKLRAQEGARWVTP